MFHYMKMSPATTIMFFRHHPCLDYQTVSMLDLLLFLAPRGSPPPLVQLGYDLTLLAKVERAAIESWELEQEQIHQRRWDQLAHAHFI